MIKIFNTECTGQCGNYLADSIGVFFSFAHFPSTLTYRLTAILSTIISLLFFLDSLSKGNISVVEG